MAVQHHTLASHAPESTCIFECFARCASGFEDILAGELRNLGVGQVRPLQGGVSFSATLEQIYGVCLWSRVATRVQVVLARIHALDAAALYDGVRAIPWENHVCTRATVAVRVHGTNRSLRNTQFTALKVKDALCDRLRQVCGSRPNVDVHDPDFAIDVSLNRERATVYVNVSGASLHRRGYRQDGEQTQAPCKETLASGIVLAAGWPRLAQDGAAFLDPMCGSGTIAIEAALIALNRAPGLARERWGFQGWAHHDEHVWARVLEQAHNVQTDANDCRAVIVAADIDPTAVALARSNAQRAGVEHVVRFLVADAADVGSYLSTCMSGPIPSTGLLAVNPPYGHRMDQGIRVQHPHAALESAISVLPDGWRVSIITPDDTIDTALGRVPTATISCFNGPIKAKVRLFDLSKSVQSHVRIVSLGGVERTVPVAEANTQQFADRVRKVAKERARWARREGVSCYRVYDADLPDYAVAVDLYESEGEGTFLRVAEYRAPNTVDAARAARRFTDAQAVLPAIFDLGSERVVTKVREHGKGGRQYRDARAASHVISVREAGYVFEADISGYLDTGLFLDHRLTRQIVEQMAVGKRFLNLFAYTGTASVYAAGGGASSTVTVDMSHTYLAWARRNMAANGFDSAKHVFVRDDCLQWLEAQAHCGAQYDLVFCDPPTFSNSKRMGSRSFDVQRDHVELIKAVAALLAPNGQVVFSCNLRSFRMDTEALATHGLAVSDITASTISHDFERSPKMHSCFLISLYE